MAILYRRPNVRTPCQAGIARIRVVFTFLTVQFYADGPSDPSRSRSGHRLTFNKWGAQSRSDPNGRMKGRFREGEGGQQPPEASGRPQRPSGGGSVADRDRMDE